MSDNKPSDKPSLWEQILFWVGVVFVLLVPTGIGLFTSTATTSWVALVCGAFVTMMSRIDRIAELSMGPLKLRLLDQLRANKDAFGVIQTAAKTYPADAPAKDIIIETTTASIKANDVIFTTSVLPRVFR